MEKRYDLAVIGAGMGGVNAAFRAASLGARVALIERHKIGGT
jgi:pyruvate/2-oxoglutarate dehydrogenase complex dihydrolipoamide dehydrogenase (E3) component